MYKKYLIIASKLDKAGINITTHLSHFKKNPLVSAMQSDEPGFDFYLTEKEIIYDEGIDKEKLNKYDFIIFASKHKSESNEKTLSIHAPGNWRRAISRDSLKTETSEIGREAEFGGQTGKICKTSAVFQKQIFEKLNENVKKHDLRNYNITLECTHHGPLIEKPCIFVEIGSTENEWKDNRAGFIVAMTIRDVIKEFKENPYNEIAIGIGGSHYCPNFNKIQLNSNVAISHIIPGYVFPLTEEMIKEAIDKTQEEIDFAILDWKGIPNAEERQRIIGILDKFHVRYKKTSDINK